MALVPVLSGAPAAAGFLFLIELLVKSTLVLGLAALLVLSLKRASAAHRHLVWACALAALVVMPWMQLALPAWRVSTPAIGRIAPGIDLLATETPAASGDPTAATSTEPRSPATGSEKISKYRYEQRTRTNPAPTPATQEALTPAPTSASPPAPAKASAHGNPVAGVIFLVWAIGALAVLSTFVAGHLILRLMIHGARRVRDGEWHALALEAADRLGLTLPFSLLRADGVLVPIATGWLRPRVLLPDGCDAWPLELRQAVLLHELAHVQRHDCLTQAIAQLACSLFWFHPGVWWATSRLQVEREHACDDRVLNARMRATDYADHLLGMVRRLRARRLAALGAVAFARPSSLEGRLLAVLDPHLDRRAVGRRVAAIAAFAAAFLVLPFAALEPVAAGTTSGHKKQAASREPSDLDALRPSRVVAVPEPGQTVEQRVAWARADAGKASVRVWWIGWTFEPSETLEGNLLCDSEGISLTNLGRQGAFTLEDVLVGRAQGTSDPERTLSHEEEKHPSSAILLRMDSGTPDRVRVQTPRLAADFRGEPLYWLDVVTDEHAFAWLRDAAERAQDPRLRARLVESIGFMGSSDLVAPYLTKTLRTATSEHVRIGAAEGLSRHPSPEGVRLLYQTSHTDPSAEVRRASVEALGQCRTPEALEALLAIAGDGSGGTRRAAFDALGTQVSERAPDPAPKPEPAATKSKSSTAKSSAAKPATSKAEPVKTEKAAKKQNEKPIAQVDEDEPSESMPAQEFEVQRQAIESLSRYPEAQSLPRLRRIAETSPNEDLRAQAVESIGRVGTPAALAALEDIAWKNSQSRARDIAVEEIGRRFPPEPALDKLARIAESHPSESAQRMAVEAIGRVDLPRAHEMLGRLARGDGDIGMRRQAVESIGRRDEPGVERELLEIVRSQAPDEVRRQAVESLGRRPGEAITAQLVEIARSNPSVDVRREAVECLGRRDEPSVPEQLMKLAREDNDEDVQRQAVETLGRHADERTRALLLDLARTHPSIHVQRQAVESLGRLDDGGGGDVMSDLASIARSHPSSEVRRQAVESMTRRDPDKALPYLEQILRQTK